VYNVSVKNTLSGHRPRPEPLYGTEEALTTCFLKGKLGCLLNEKQRINMTKKAIALVAHDNKKHELLEWAKFNKQLMAQYELYATGTTGTLLEKEVGIKVHKLQSGPLGGDQQIGAKISQQEIDFLVFFWDPLASLSHDSDIKALLRISVVWNIPVACNRASADFMITSPLLSNEYQPHLPDYQEHVTRAI